MLKKILSSYTRVGMILLLITAVVFGGFSLSPPVSAACAAPSKSYGTATMQLTVPTAGNYRIWTHMKAADTTNNSYLLEIDGGNCFTVGDTAIATGAWTWVDHQNANTASKVTVNLTAGTHTFKAIGREPNVKIDRILVTADQNCLPSGLGDNCMAKADTTKPVTTITMPDNLSTVSGEVSVKADASDNTGITRVEFYIQDVLKATDATSAYEYKWNTALQANGTYTITVKAYDAAGNSSVDARSVTVKNGVVKAPVAPVKVAAKATAPNQVALTWQAGVGAATDLRYRIVRNNVTIATVTALAFTDKTVAAGTEYGYRVISVDKDNNTSSTTVTPTTVKTPALPVKDTIAPTKPTGMTATAASTSQINLAWKASTDTIGVKGYDLYRSKNGAVATKVATVTGTSYGDSGLSANTPYTYHVVARDAAGNSSPASDKVKATTKTAPPVVQRFGTLRGTIKSSSGRPLAGAKVMIWVNNKRHMATTNWRGQYIIAKIPAGKYEVKVKASSYPVRTYTVQINAGKIKWFDATLRR